MINGVDPNPGDGYDENGSNIRGEQNIGRGRRAGHHRRREEEVAGQPRVPTRSLDGSWAACWTPSRLCRGRPRPTGDPPRPRRTSEPRRIARVTERRAGAPAGGGRRRVADTGRRGDDDRRTPVPTTTRPARGAPGSRRAAGERSPARCPLVPVLAALLVLLLAAAAFLWFTRPEPSAIGTADYAEALQAARSASWT